MSFDWKTLFTKGRPAFKDAWNLSAPPQLNSISRLRAFLDLVHIKYCLVKPFCEIPDYPLVETRELLPSFEADLWEHKKLPGFSLVAFERPIHYFTEVFQFDLLRPVSEDLRSDHAQMLMSRNLGVLQSRMPRGVHDHLRLLFQKQDVSSMSMFPSLTPFLMTMDRAQVLGMHGTTPQDMNFHLAGVYGSLPSDLDTEVKRYGLRIGKFSLEDPEMYERNRNFVLQHLMELYGFPIASERRTSAALFARRLHKMGEKFLIRTLGQSDRTLTTLWHDGPNRAYPHVEKIALAALEEEDEQTDLLRRGGYFIDVERRVVIVRLRYRQHKFSPDNVRQERALSVESQEIIHPLTGWPLTGLSFIRDTSNMFLRLNDIVRGEYTGRVIYKRNEIVENTDTDEKRLKFLYAWLTKHQRRIIGYSDEFFANIDRVLDNYLRSSDSAERFSDLKELYQEVFSRYRYIHQARKIRVLEDLRQRAFKGARISYQQMFAEAVALLHSLKFEIVSYFDNLVGTAIAIGESILNDGYVVRKYIDKPDDALTRNGLEIKRNYGRLVALLDEFKAIRRSRQERTSASAGISAAPPAGASAAVFKSPPAP